MSDRSANEELVMVELRAYRMGIQLQSARLEALLAGGGLGVQSMKGGGEDCENNVVDVDVG